MKPSLDRAALAAFVRDYRRPLAAGCAALAVLALGTAALSPPTPPTDPNALPAISSGDVAMPITLTSANAVVRAGDVIDLVAMTDGSRSRVVASQARVVQAPNGNGFGGASGRVVVVAIPQATALEIADALSTSTLTALIHPPASD